MRWWMAALCWGLGCAHAPVVVKAPEARAVDVVAVVASVEAGGVGSAPDSVVEGLKGVLEDRGLTSKTVAEDAWVGRFRSHRSTSQRIRYVSDQISDDVWLLVESEVRWYAQVAGRYRWTVDVVLTLGDAEGEVLGQEAFQVPVFLTWDHQREPEAMEGARAVIERRVAELVDGWVATMSL